MVETRLTHSSNRSGTNNVELSPVGDYRRGDCPLKHILYSLKYFIANLHLIHKPLYLDFYQWHP